MAKILIVTVQYRNCSDTARFAQSINRLHGSREVELVVVDNAADDQSTGQLEELAASVGFPLHILKPDSNLYYWGGAAHALNQFRAERNALPTWAMISNNDIEVRDRDFLGRLFALDPKDYPIVAPDILSSTTGRHQNPLLESRPTFLKRVIWKVYDLNFHLAQTMLGVRSILNRRGPRNAPEAGTSGGARPIYAAHGAGVILSSAFFAKGGMLDTTVPMFAEELTLALEAERLGLAIRYVPELRIVHREHSTTGDHLTKEKYEMERAARRRYFLAVSNRQRDRGKGPNRQLN